MKAEDFAQPSALLAFRHKRVPSVAGLRLDASETGSRRRVGDADEVLAGWALNLPASVARVALQRLIAVRTVKLEFGCAHSLDPYHAQTDCQKYIGKYSYFPPMLCACRSR
jgi:hypothetical protein